MTWWAKDTLSVHVRVGGIKIATIRRVPKRYFGPFYIHYHGTDRRLCGDGTSEHPWHINVGKKRKTLSRSSHG